MQQVLHVSLIPQCTALQCRLSLPLVITESNMTFLPFQAL